MSRSGCECDYAGEKLCPIHGIKAKAVSRPLPDAERIARKIRLALIESADRWMADEAKDVASLEKIQQDTVARVLREEGVAE